MLPLLLWLLLCRMLHRFWTVVVSFFVTLSLLLLASASMVPHWLPHWLADVHGYGPHTLLPLEAVFGHWLGLIASLVLVLWCAFLLWKLRWARPGSPKFGLAASLALAATVSVTLFKLPVLYNNVLAVPGCLILGFLKA